MPNFTVDTHLFRELGELLVGRDSTALVELIKNAYDADATSVTVYAHQLDDVNLGYIRITDDGTGMTRAQFEKGFLRIASRTKDQGSRVSSRYQRQYTGSKGIGRLAAHKLARTIDIESVAWSPQPTTNLSAISATIDWDLVEQKETLDQLDETEAITISSSTVSQTNKSGTTITLRKLRKPWTPYERAQFLSEINTFAPPPILVSELPSTVLSSTLMFSRPTIRSLDGGHHPSTDPGFAVTLEGEFEQGENYWPAVAEAANWVIEIEAAKENPNVLYNIAPTQKTLAEDPSLQTQTFISKHPAPNHGPFFQARILIRDGQLKGMTKNASQWAAKAGGIRLFLEGFRVLPYGEPGNDWLSIDLDYTRRNRSLPWLDEQEQTRDRTADEDEGLNQLPNRAYFGAVFLTEAGSQSLRTLVNREGFVPDGSYHTLVQLIRRGIDLSTRIRAAARYQDRRARKKMRSERKENNTPTGEVSQLGTSLRDIEASVERATQIAYRAQQTAATGDYAAATAMIVDAASHVQEVAQASADMISQGAILRVLASVGTQMAAFIHEINGLMSMVDSIDGSVAKLRTDPTIPPHLRMELSRLHNLVTDLLRRLERQSAYLIDIVTPDARRRRSRQSLRERFDAGRRLVDTQAQIRSVEIKNEIPSDLKSPAMFPAELTTVFSNLLTNAVKAAGNGGMVWAHTNPVPDERVHLVIENTGTEVAPEEGEHWFRPFESTTVAVDPVLGQGMGLGLPITRGMLEEYGATIKFVSPSEGFATALEITFPK